MKQNELFLLGAGLLAVVIFSKGMKKTQLAENLKIRFKKVSFGTKGIIPILTLNLIADNPINESQEVTAVTATITTPKGNITSNLRQPFTIGANASSDFQMIIEPTLSLIPAVQYIAQNFRTKPLFVDLRIVTPLGTFTDKLPIKI